ncbi:MAG: DUF1704 domain-containing protein [Polyangiales bacterium]
MSRLHEVTRRLPAAVAHREPEERARLVEAASKGRHVVPRFSVLRVPVERAAFAVVDRARRLAEAHVAGALYAARLDELELDLAMMDALGDPRRVRPMSARRFGRGSSLVWVHGREVTVRSVADELLAHLEPAPEKKTLPARATAFGPSLEDLARRVAAIAGLDVEVRIEPRLVANAAAGERTVFLADRWFGAREAVRLAVHEVLGHLVAAANGRRQPLGLLATGTAGSFEDQEGLSILLEDRAGVLDAERLRILAGRVLATDAMHEGASFGEAVRLLRDEHGFGVESAITLAERAYRGGGIARDVVYLRGYLRVREAVETGTTTIDELRIGRVGLEALALLETPRTHGWVLPPHHRPDLETTLDRALLGARLGRAAAFAREPRRAFL